VPVWLRFAIPVALVLVARFFGPWWIVPWQAHAPAPAGALRIVTWNLHNFPNEAQDLDRIEDALADLDADVLVLQEIHDPAALARVLPHHRVAVSRGAGSHGQHVAIAWHPARVQRVGEPIEHDAVALGGRVRPMLEVTLRTARGPITILGVHLKAGADGLPLRQLQWITVAARVLQARREGPVAVLGDFNPAGGRALAAEAELERLEAILATVGLRRVPGVGPCTAYWEGVRRDGWLVPSVLDLAFVTGDLEITEPAWIGSACARHRCDPVHSTEAHPDPDLGGIGDHCPVVVDLR
jgi:endonuclease/exonuclease/phosphatase family metal-dependent hydrolase